MKGYAIVDGKFAESADLEQIKAAMPMIKSHLDLLAVELVETLSRDEMETLLNKIDFLSEHWNRNVEVLIKAEQIMTIRRVKQSIGQLKWPPDEAPAGGSST